MRQERNFQMEKQMDNDKINTSLCFVSNRMYFATLLADGTSSEEGHFVKVERENFSYAFPLALNVHLCYFLPMTHIKTTKVFLVAFSHSAWSNNEKKKTNSEEKSLVMYSIYTMGYSLRQRVIIWYRKINRNKNRNEEDGKNVYQHLLSRVWVFPPATGWWVEWALWWMKQSWRCKRRQRHCPKRKYIKCYYWRDGTDLLTTLL